MVSLEDPFDFDHRITKIHVSTIPFISNKEAVSSIEVILAIYLLEYGCMARGMRSTRFLSCPKQDSIWLPRSSPPSKKNHHLEPPSVVGPPSLLILYRTLYPREELLAHPSPSASTLGRSGIFNSFEHRCKADYIRLDTLIHSYESQRLHNCKATQLSQSSISSSSSNFFPLLPVKYKSNGVNNVLQIEL